MGEQTVDVDQLFRWLRALDVDSCSLEVVTSAMVATRPVRGWLDVMDARIRARDRELRNPEVVPIPPGGPVPPAGPDAGPTPEPPPPLPLPPAGSGPGGNPINDSAGIGHAEGRRRDRVSQVLERFVGLDALLAAGVITTEHVQTICRSIHRLDPRIDEVLNSQAAEIVKAAGELSCRRLRRFMTALITRIAADLKVDAPRSRQRSTLRHWIDRSSGQGKVFAELNPEDYQRFVALLRSAQNQIAGGMPGAEPDEIAAIALMGLIGAVDGVGGLRAVTHVNVLIDLETITNGTHVASICEFADGTPINPADLPYLTCGADQTEILLKDRLPLNVGRTQRLATAAQHRAIEAIHTTCAIADCTVPITMCELHHIQHWEHGGFTDLDNLVPMCSYHHHRSHDQGWKLEVGQDRTLRTITGQGATAQDAHVTGPDRLSSPFLVSDPLITAKAS